MPQLVRLRHLDIVAEWEKFNREHSYASTSTARRGFNRYLKTLVIELEHYLLDSRAVAFCADCSTPNISSRLYSGYTARGSTLVCRACAAGYLRCGQCDVYYRVNPNRTQHNHRSRSCCSSSAQAFTIRNGEGSLSNDTRVAVGLPAGEITDVGIGAISGFLRESFLNEFYETQASDYDAARRTYNHKCTLANSLASLGNQWQTKQGNYAKRLSRLAYKDYGFKITPAQLTQIGNIASDHSKGVEYSIETTRKLNMPARVFAHAESCWWTSYRNSRCVLKTNGGFGIRAFENNQVAGRAWVMPLKKIGDGRRSRVELAFTYETLDADAYVVFNGYGTLHGYAPSRILSQMVGMTYRKIGFSAHPMYINSESGYLVAPVEIAEPYTDSSLVFSPSTHANLYETEHAEALRRSNTRERVNA